MAKRISELDPATLPVDTSSLIEIAEPNGSSPTGYVSKSAPLSAISGGFIYRFYFSGLANVNEFNEWVLVELPYSELVKAAPPGTTSFPIGIGAATLNYAISVLEQGNTNYGATSGTVILVPNGNHVMNYLSSDANTNAAPVTLPYTPPTTSGTISAVITRLTDDNANSKLIIGAGLASSGSQIGNPIEYVGYVDITVVPAIQLA